MMSESYGSPQSFGQCEDSSAGASAPNSVHFRFIRPDDRHRLQLFHQRLTPGTVRLRFHSAKRELSAPLARRFTELDGHNNVAIVATTGTRGRIIGVARYCRIAPVSAEVAFVVEDAFQGHGIGRRLMQQLVAEAGKNGIREFVAEILPGNTPMLRLLEEWGPIRVRHDPDGDEVRLDLTDVTSRFSDKP